MNMTGATKDLQANSKHTSRAIVVRFDLNRLRKYSCGFDDESTKQIVYGR
jgi:hypothetical protein